MSSPNASARILLYQPLREVAVHRVVELAAVVLLLVFLPPLHLRPFASWLNDRTRAQLANATHNDVTGPVV